MNRRTFAIWSAKATLVATCLPLLSQRLYASSKHFSPLLGGPQVDRFKIAERHALTRYGVSARSRFVRIKSAQLPMHVLEMGRGSPILLLHGGGLSACSWAQLLAPLQENYSAFAPDLPGCGRTYRIDFHGLPFRATAENLILEIMDALRLRNAIVIGHSMGGYFGLVFAL
jgi:pimeloyl-ACP methyl ester carboxylesterase